MSRTTRLAAVLVVILVALPAAASALPSMPSSNFPASTGCGCHSELVGQWQPSMHQQALTDPIYLSKLAEADEATDGEVTPFCLQCHSPIAVMAGEAEGLDHSGVSDVGMEGVTCTFCHHVTGTTDPVGNASQIVSEEDVRVAQLKDPQAPHAAAYSQFHETAEFCGSCHNVNHPTNGVHLEATYTEWSEGPYAAEGVVCQDCHMTPGPGVTKPNPGKAASTGPEREHIYTMTFAGGNVALGDAVLAEERLKAAATLELEVPEVVESGEVPVMTTITNSGAGHYLPTGLTEVRQMWLEVTATDENGAELLSERREFGTIMEDADGNHPAEMWDAVAIYSDDRIPPQESTSNEYSFPMASGPVTVKAALYYRSCSEEIADKAGVDVPTTTMAEVTEVVYSSAEAAEADEDVEEPEADEEPVEADTGLGTVELLLIGAGVLVLGIAIYLITRSRAKQ
ncbi:multiheme c-type cytochrome [Anaerosoma tenue]|uniref:multiheme c-type cytochrome n=1 Tax=Anaerosoma tenue TaxID=2933588 RepID=UPI002260F0D6|nr:multiheme c-type cytochrome [Anaerosoma tenue]MCK8115166.1 cytochrome c family protein [Anaerosoma tenue]